VPGRQGVGKLYVDVERVHPLFPCDKAIRKSRFSRFTWSGTRRRSFLGIPATGKRIDVKGAVIDRLWGARWLTVAS
jgi:hypothetical protein